MIWLIKTHLVILAINCILRGLVSEEKKRPPADAALGQLRRCETLCQNDDACKSGQCVLVYCSDTVSCYRFCMECHGVRECYETGAYCAYVDLPISRVTSAAMRNRPAFMPRFPPMPPPLMMQPPRRSLDFASSSGMFSDSLFKKISFFISSIMLILKSLLSSFFKFKFF